MTIDSENPGKTETLHPRNSKGAETAEGRATRASEDDRQQPSPMLSDSRIEPSTTSFDKPTACVLANPIHGKIDVKAFVKELMVHDKVIMDYLAK